MDWQISFTTEAQKELKKLDRQAQIRILRYIKERLAINLLEYGESLKENWTGYRRYRVGDYRIICDVQEEIITVIVVKIGHRSKVYGGH